PPHGVCALPLFQSSAEDERGGSARSRGPDLTGRRSDRRLDAAAALVSRFASAENGDRTLVPRQRAPRSLWTGAISFGLVNVPVKVYTAVHEHKLRFHLVHEKDDGAIG